MRNVNESAGKLREILQNIGAELVERESLLQLIVLAAVAREHLLVLGPPGTAKSAAVRAIAHAFDGRYFEYLLGRFTEPSELFGPVDLRKLRDGVVETETRGMLPEADIAFLDEIFLGSTAILNTLLGILNERRFKRGHNTLNCPLRICVAASNELPDDPALAAFADRFLVRLYVEPLPDSLLEQLLEAGWRSATQEPGPHTRMSLLELDQLSEAARHVDMAPARETLAQCIRQLRKAGIQLTDRRIVKTQSLAAASAVLNGRDHATSADLWPLIYVIPTPEAQQHAREVLQDTLALSANAILPHAVHVASAGPLARAGAVLSTGERLLAERPETIIEDSPWALRAEALLREIDAGFSGNNLPEMLLPLRQQLVADLSGGPQ